MIRTTINVDQAKPLTIYATADTTFELDIILDEAVTGTVTMELSATVGDLTVQFVAVVADTTISFRGNYTLMGFATGVYNYAIVVTDPATTTRRNLFYGSFILRPRT